MCLCMFTMCLRVLLLFFCVMCFVVVFVYVCVMVCFREYMSQVFAGKLF